MSEVLENPVIRISGAVSEKEYKAALRARNVRVFLKLTAVYVSLMLVMTIGSSMYYAYPYIKSCEHHMAATDTPASPVAEPSRAPRTPVLP